MAGYIFSLNSMDSLEKSIAKGIYSTIMNIPKNEIWTTAHEGTFADYLTMKEGDNVYFFHERRIYGIGELVDINGDCKFLNFPDADLPSPYMFKDIKHSMILDGSDNVKNRMLCTFKGSPHFFKEGVDMDEVLSSNPDKFKMLRAFWKLSFIKVDDKENQALIDIILKNNENSLQESNDIFLEYETIHKKIKKIADEDYKVKSEKILSICAEQNHEIRHEMAIEAGILDCIANNKCDIFGEWDYLSHQVVASPFKPVDYMDKMDIFGYRYISGFNTISKYLTIEIKKGLAQPEDINQVMKYVDWINQEYSFGDYNMIEAFLVAFDFPPEVVSARKKIARRNFIKSRRPVYSTEWENLRLIKYKFNPDEKNLEFYEV